MNYLVIKNKGEIELGGLSLLGASVKENEAIGMFGSGTKYALACILRHGLEIKIHSGLSEISIETKTETLRGQEFGVIYLNSERTSITTNTGPKWKVTDAVREFYSNALDEGEASVELFLNDSLVSTSQDTTTICIEANDEIFSMFKNWNNYFLPANVEVLHSNKLGRIVASYNPNYFRRGVWVCEDRENVPLFSYDFKNMDLPESRKMYSSTLKYSLNSLFYDCADSKIFSIIFDNRQRPDLPEWHFLSTYSFQANKTALKEVFLSNYNMLGHETNKNRIKLPENISVFWCGGNVYEALKNADCPLVEKELGVSDYYNELPWPIGFESRLQAALKVLEKNDIIYPVSTKYTFCIFTKNSFLALADMEKNLVCLSDGAFKTDKDLILALLEEWTHVTHGVQDHTIEQQYVYLNLIHSLLR